MVEALWPMLALRLDFDSFDDVDGGVVVEVTCELLAGMIVVDEFGGMDDEDAIGIESQLVVVDCDENNISA